MNLFDIIPVSSKGKKTLDAKIFDEFEKTRTDIETTLKTVGSVIDRRTAAPIVEKLLEKLNKDSRTVIGDFFLKNLVVPDNLPLASYHHDSYTGGLQVQKLDRDYMNRLSQSPKVGLSDLVEIANIAGMVIIPFDYLNQESYSKEDYNTKSIIRIFDTASKDVGLETWVICPIRHYSIINHLKASDPNRQIVGNAYQGNFDVLNMMMPALLMMSDRLTAAEGGISALYRRVNELDASMKGVVRGLESMEKQLKALQDKVEAQHRETLMLSINETQFLEQSKGYSLRESNWFMPYEPLMFATIPNPDFSSKEPGLIGPCWGPDFPEIVAATLKWKQKKGQRTALEKEINRIWY